MANILNLQVDIFNLALWLTLDTVLQCLLGYETNCQIKDDDYANLMYKITGKGGCEFGAKLTRINCGPLDPLAPLTCTLNHIVHPAGLLVKRIYAPQYSYDWVYALTKDGKEYFELAKRFEVGTSAWIKAIKISSSWYKISFVWTCIPHFFVSSSASNFTGSIPIF